MTPRPMCIQTPTPVRSDNDMDDPIIALDPMTRRQTVLLTTILEEESLPPPSFTPTSPLPPTTVLPQEEEHPATPSISSKSKQQTTTTRNERKTKRVTFQLNATVYHEALIPHLTWRHCQTLWYSSKECQVLKASSRRDNFGCFAETRALVVAYRASCQIAATQSSTTDHAATNNNKTLLPANQQAQPHGRQRQRRRPFTNNTNNAVMLLSSSLHVLQSSFDRYHDDCMGLERAFLEWIPSVQKDQQERRTKIQELIHEYNKTLHHDRNDKDAALRLRRQLELWTRPSVEFALFVAQAQRPLVCTDLTNGNKNNDKTKKTPKTRFWTWRRYPREMTMAAAAPGTTTHGLPGLRST